LLHHFLPRHQRELANQNVPVSGFQELGDEAGIQFKPFHTLSISRMTELSPEVQVHATCVKVGYQIRFINKFCESTRTNLRRGQGSRAKFDDLFRGLTC